VHRTSEQGSAQPRAMGSSSGDDSALVAAVLGKDRKATAEFVARYTDPLYNYVRFRLAPRYDQVDDLVQETFLAAWESLNRYQANGSLLAWLIGIARHKVEDYYRERLRAPEIIDEADEIQVATAPIPEFHQLLEQDELRRNTQRVLAGLPELYRLALLWRYWEKASAREIALKTGKTEKAIERLLARARAEFRERWHHGQSS
jgi:RNA polymerase sigma factor (sigma-70 family)